MASSALLKPISLPRGAYHFLCTRPQCTAGCSKVEWPKRIPQGPFVSELYYKGGQLWVGHQTHPRAEIFQTYKIDGYSDARPLVRKILQELIAVNERKVEDIMQIVVKQREALGNLS